MFCLQVLMVHGTRLRQDLESSATHPSKKKRIRVKKGTRLVCVCIIYYIYGVVVIVHAVPCWWNDFSEHLLTFHCYMMFHYIVFVFVFVLCV